MIFPYIKSKAADLAAYLKKSELIYIVLLILVALYPRLRYYQQVISSPYGIPKPPDTVWYLEHAQNFINTMSFSMDFNGIFYFNYYSLLAFLIMAFKSLKWVVLFQVIVNALTVIIVYEIGKMLFNRRTAFIAGIIYGYTWQIIEWSVYILTDSLFMTVFLLTVYFMVKACQTHGRCYRVCFALTGIYMVFFRPTGIFSLAFICIYPLLYADYQKIRKSIVRYRFHITAVSALLTACLVAAVASGRLSPLFESVFSELRWLIREMYGNGHVFDIKTPYDLSYEPDLRSNYFNNFPISFIINNWNYVLALLLKKAVFFWAPWIWSDNPARVAENLRYFAVVYFFAVVSLYFIVREKQLKKVSILLLAIGSVWFFCIVFFIDTSFRYRSPGLAFLDIVAAYGVDGILQVVGKQFVKQRKLKPCKRKY